MNYELINKFINDFSNSIEFESTDTIELDLKFKGFPSLESFIDKNSILLNYSFLDFHIKYNNNFFNFPNLKEDIHLWGIEETKDHDFHVKIKIIKNSFIELMKLPSNIENIYFFSSFEMFMKQVDLGTIESQNDKFKYNVIIASNSNEYFNNDYINILFTSDYSIPSSFTFEIGEYKFLKIKRAKELYSNILQKNELNDMVFPFFWDFDFDNNLIKKKLLSNFFDLISNKKIDNWKYNIKGQQSLSLDFSMFSNEIINLDSKLIIRLIDFTIDDEERFLDKILIIRNVLSTYLTNESPLEYFVYKLKEISSTIDYNFELYIQEKVKIFLEQKNKLANEALDVAKNTSKLTNEITSILRTVVFSLVGTILITLVSNLDINTSNRIISASLLSYMLYFGITLANLQHFVTEADIINKNFENYFKKISNEEIEGFKLEDIKEDFIDSSRNEFDKMILVLKRILVVLIVLFLIVFIAIRFDINFLFIKTVVRFLIG